MDINDIYGIIDKFDASGCSELNLEMNGVCLGLKKTMHEAICDVPVKRDIVRINTEQEQTITAIQDVQPQSDEHIKEIKAPLVGTFYTGYKGLKAAHKYFAFGSLICMIMAVYSGHKMISGNKSTRKQVENTKAEE